MSTGAAADVNRRAAVLGSPVGHSLSPVLHRAAYTALGLDWRYDALEVGSVAALRRFLAQLDPVWAGLSLTMPLKRVVLPLLDEVSRPAMAVESVNTVLLRWDPVGGPGAHLRGENTDVPGMVAALREAGVDRVARAAVLGGGATAGSAVAALGEVCKGPVTAYVRDPARAGVLVRVARRLGVALTVAPWARADDGLGAPLVVSTVPPGAADGLAAAVPASPGVLLDVVYDPWPTALAAAWSAAGGRVSSGLDLLIHQAARQVRLMTGRPAPWAAMRAAGAAAIAARG